MYFGINLCLKDKQSNEAVLNEIQGSMRRSQEKAQ